MRKLACGLGAALVAALLMGCGLFGGGSPPPRAQSSPDSSATPTLSPSEGLSPSASPTPVILEDGRHPVFIKSINVSGRTMTFDLTIFLTGTAAVKAWQDDHPGQTGGPDNDYYIVNNNPKLRTLPVALDVEVSVVSTSGPIPTNAPLTFGLLPSHFGGSYGERTFWLTVSGGQIVRIEEQYLP